MTFGFGRMDPVHRAFRMAESEIRKWQVYLLCLEFYHCAVDASGYGLLCNSMILSYRRLFASCLCTPRITRTACTAIRRFDCLALTEHTFFVCTVLTHCAVKSIALSLAPSPCVVLLIISFDTKPSVYQREYQFRYSHIDCCRRRCIWYMRVDNVFPVPLLLNNNYRFGIERKVLRYV